MGMGRAAPSSAAEAEPPRSPTLATLGLLAALGLLLGSGCPLVCPLLPLPCNCFTESSSVSTDMQMSLSHLPACPNRNTWHQPCLPSLLQSEILPGGLRNKLGEKNPRPRGFLSLKFHHKNCTEGSELRFYKQT